MFQPSANNHELNDRTEGEGGEEGEGGGGVNGTVSGSTSGIGEDFTCSSPTISHCSPWPAITTSLSKFYDLTRNSRLNRRQLLAKLQSIYDIAPKQFHAVINTLHQNYSLVNSGGYHECISGKSCREYRCYAIPGHPVESHALSECVLKHRNAVTIDHRSNELELLDPRKATWRIHCEMCDNATSRCENWFIRWRLKGDDDMACTSEFKNAERKCVYSYVVRGGMTNIDLVNYVCNASPKYAFEVLLTLSVLNKAIVKYDENGLPKGLPAVIRFYISEDMPCSGPELTHLITSEQYGPIFYLQLPPYCYFVPIKHGSSFKIKAKMKTIYHQIASHLCNKKEKAARSVMARFEISADTTVIHRGFDNGIINIP